MTYKRFMVVYAILTFVFGLGFILSPGIILPIYGIEPNAAIIFLANLFGAVLISLALLAWLSRKFSANEARQVIILALLIGEALGLVLAFIGQINGVLNDLGWFIVLIYLIMTLGLAYFQFIKSRS